jgi:lysophospholipase L1-like esterase
VSCSQVDPPTNTLCFACAIFSIMCVLIGLLLYYTIHFTNAQLIQADILLRGYIGWNSRRALQVIDKIFPKDSPVQPSLVIVYFGGNDSVAAHSSGLGPHVPLEEYIDNMRKIADHLKSLSEKTRVIFLSCPPLNEETLRKSTRCKLGIILISWLGSVG